LNANRQAHTAHRLNTYITRVPALVSTPYGAAIAGLQVSRDVHTLGSPGRPR